MVIYPRSLKGVCRGSILIYALGMTALVSTLSTAMILSLQSDMRWVNKQNVLIEQRSNLMAIETKTMTLLNSHEEKKRAKKSFEVTINGTPIKGDLLLLSNEKSAWDKKIPLKGSVAVLHSTINGSHPIEVYSIFNQKDKHWQLVYRSHGARR